MSLDEKGLQAAVNQLVAYRERGDIILKDYGVAQIIEAYENAKGPSSNEKFMSGLLKECLWHICHPSASSAMPVEWNASHLNVIKRAENYLNDLDCAIARHESSEAEIES